MVSLQQRRQQFLYNKALQYSDDNNNNSNNFGLDFSMLFGDDENSLFLAFIEYLTVIAIAIVIVCYC